MCLCCKHSSQMNCCKIFECFKVDSGNDFDVAPASKMAVRSDLLSHGSSFPEVSAIDRGVFESS